jgi:hypothetical protein
MLASNTWGADPAISIKVTPRMQHAPGNLILIIRIPKDDSNRQYCFGYGDHDQYSCRQLNGSSSPLIFLEDFKNIYEGEYEAFVELYRTPNTEKIYQKATDRFNVISAP